MNISDLISYPPAYGLHGMDSDDVEAALKRLNINPDNCTVEDAVLALTTLSAPFAPPPRRAGAPRGNKNNKRTTVRENKLLIHLTADEQAAIAAAANGMPVARWVREAALEKANCL